MLVLRFALFQITVPTATILAPCVLIVAINDLSSAIQFLASGGFLLTSLFMLLHLTQDIEDAVEKDARIIFKKVKLVSYVSALIFGLVFMTTAAILFSLKPNEIYIASYLAVLCFTAFVICSALCLNFYRRYLGRIAP